MNREELLSYCKMKESQAFSGWDFSLIANDYFEEPPPWDYKKKLQEFIKPETRLLDMGTGGGEFLLSLGHNLKLTSVTEGYPPNLELCKKRLEPMGITVKGVDDEGILDFPDNSFDLVINRHEFYNLQEVKRVLKPNGFFITQQVGGTNNLSLSKALMPSFEPAMPDFNLENENLRFKQAGFHIMSRDQSYRSSVFTDIGAIVYYAKIIPWSFPNFNVDESIDRLEKLQAIIEKTGEIRTESHRFIIIAKSPNQS